MTFAAMAHFIDAPGCLHAGRWPGDAEVAYVLAHPVTWLPFGGREALRAS
jgi:hypothetical protein